MSADMSEKIEKNNFAEDVDSVGAKSNALPSGDDQPEQITFDDQPYETVPEGDDVDGDQYGEADDEYEYEDDGEYPGLEDFDEDGDPRLSDDEFYEGDDEYIADGGVRLSDDGIGVLPSSGAYGRKSVSDRVRESVLIQFFGAVFLWIFQRIRYSFISFALSTNKWMKNGFDKAFVKRFLNSSAISAKIFKLKRTAARLLSESYIISGRAELGGVILRTPVRRFGAFLLATGGGTVALYTANLFVFKAFNIPTSQLYVGILMCIPSIVMLAFSGTVLDFIRSSRIMHMIVFGFFNADIKLKDERPVVGNISAVLLAGLAIACLSLLIPLHELIIMIALLICAAIVLKSPEVGVIALILILPFADFSLVMLLMVAVWISYALKYLCGKRVINFEYVDVFPLILFVLFLLGGVVTAGGMSIRSLVPAALISLYFLVAGIIRDSVWAKRCRTAFAIDAVIMSVFALLRIIPGNPFGVDMIFRGQSDIGGSTDSAFRSSGILAVILGMLLLIQIAGVFSEKSRGARLGFAAISVAALVSAAFSTYFLTFFLILAVAFTLLIFINKGFLGAVGASALFLLFMPIFGLPSIESMMLQTDAALYYRRFLWQDCLGLIPDIFTSGIGASPEAFQMFYDGVWNVSDPKCLALSLIVSYGICGILFFSAVLFFFIQYCFTHGRSCSDKKVPSRLYTYAGMCAVLLVVLIGITENVFFNYRVAAMFWIVMGFTVSVQRYSARESSHDYLDDPNIVPEI